MADQMTEVEAAQRQAALAMALQFLAPRNGTAKGVVEVAEQFNRFLSGEPAEGPKLAGVGG